MNAPSREPTEIERSAPLNLRDVPARRREAASQLAAAFCLLPNTILGTPVSPITLATWSMLVASGNVFVVGGQIRECDIRNFIWFHHRLYRGSCSWTWRIRKWLAFNRLRTICRDPIRRMFGIKRPRHHYRAIMVIAARQIRQMVDAAVCLFPGDPSNRHVPIASMEAQLIHVFATVYGWAPERTRNMPLPQLYQMLRIIMHGRGQKIRDHIEEELLHDHMKARNAELSASRIRAS